MKLILVLIIFCLCTGILYSQYSKITEDPPVLYIFTDKLPKFNYEKDLNKYVYSNLKWESQLDAIGTVLVSFVVNKKGNVEQIKIVKGLNIECDEAVIRVFESMPLWEPGEKDSKSVDVLMYFPVKFIIKGK
jgi:periplasmic protein TonB